MLLAKKYESAKHDPTGWFVSEKLDGYRAFWDPKKKMFFSRNGLEFKVPPFFIKNAPKVPLDGEIWYGRQAWEKAGTIRHDVPVKEEWEKLYFKVFDAPEHGGIYEERVEYLKTLFAGDKHKYFKLVETWVCKGHDDLMADLEKYTKDGAEGLMIRKPGSLYETKRSNTLLKVKSFDDEEAEVIAHTVGKGRLAGLVGALTVKNEKGTFNVGSGLNDHLRQPENAPPIGSIITFKYWDVTKNGIPKFPVFMRMKVAE